jgi:hypothetical protein
MFDKLFNWCKRSVTIVWARIQMLSGVVLLALAPLLDALNSSPDLKAILVTSRPWLIGLALIGFITELCRRRTIPKTP